MVINRGEMKRKRREECPSPLLDESPKRTKVHAQRKFAQGSNVNSPVITPVKEIERQEIDVLPEPVELLPIKRPNTEDFLTFLCFRGTPILPPSLNFFNTASIVDTNGQVHEIKSESPKNGPIDTSSITKAGSGSSERPFIAFGVRKRADPIVISRQMDKKRRHALALQALRRKYQEQRMAKIRAVTISKLSEKVTNKTLVRSNSVSKNEVVAKKTAIPKAKEVIKDERMTTRSVKAQIKQKMCLRSFRGRFVQRELQFRNVKKRPLPVKKLPKVVKEEDPKKNESEYSSDDERPLSKGSPKVIQKIAKKTAPGPRKPVEIRITRSNKFLNTKMVSRRQQIKQRMLLSTPKTIVKPRTLRSHTGQKPKKLFVKTEEKKDAEAKEVKESTPPVKKQTKIAETKEVKKEESEKKGKVDATKKVGNKNVESLKKATSPVTLSKNKPEKSSVVKKEIESAKKPKVVPKPTSQNVENKSVSEAKKEILPKKKPPVVLKKNVSKVIEKKENKKEIVKSEETDKKVEEQKDNMELRTSQRPTRKTKEAAAIYMEILSHKLVNDGTVDDDNVSIDSFPELPNVKKTEQRENELKAKAKSNKPDSESTEKRNVKKEVEVVESKVLRSGDKKKGNECKKIEKKEEKKTEEPKKKVEETDRKTRSANLDKAVTSSLEKMKEVELKVHINPIDVETENTKVKTETKEPPAKKKCNEKVPEPTNSESDTSEDSIKKKVEEKNKKSNEVEVTRRQTRNSSQVIKHVETDDSDESFRADIRIPRKKQITRSKVKNIESEEEGVKKSLRVNSRSYKECTSSDSDHSTTSDVNVKPVRSLKNKKFTKTRGQQKEDESFSDSDEEPLSKLTQNKKESKESPPKEIKIQAEVKPKEKEKVTENEEKESFVKPKRECAKRPQNYLPMLSSSDEEETYFHGFKVKDEKQRKTMKVENSCAHVATTSDLSCKDVGRRFGKGKVNMSTEQIEKWLKDSAMAGSSVKNENDEMLKFGEKIPTETSHSVASSIDTEKLKSLLITNVDKTETDPEKKEVSPKIETEKDTTKPIKPSLADRKLIFRNKDKGGRVNVNAFSANNENSVYAFEETEDLMKTPFRRPARRPSSTATSRSEDETTRFDDLPKTCQFRRPPLLKQDSSKSEEDKSNEDNSFNAPLQPQKAKLLPMIDKKPLLNTSMTPPTSQKASTLKHPTKPPPRQLDLGDDAKYKVPSSPSASSSSSAKLYKRQNIKLRTSEVLPVKLPDFPVGGACGQLVEAPTFHPTEKEFQDPLEYIEKIRSKAEQFGICRIVPPATFKPECKVTDDMRFTAYNQFVHKMLHRWGPNFKELMAIKKYLSTQNISLTHPPWIGGMEIDLPRLYQTVQSLGGLKEVIEKKKWPKVSDAMKIPKSAQDRVTKLDDIYCKYLLPYDTLSPAEREKLFDEVETEWAKRESKSLLKAQQNVEDNMTEGESESDDEAEECIVKGRSMALNAFYRIARNTMSMWFKNSEPLAEEVEQEFWKHVTLKQNHICVHSGSIDSGNWGYGFAVSKNSPFARHSWNLKVLTNNSGSILRSMGPVMGVTVPTLHVGMVFSSCCWYRDPHSLPWIEYLHTGGSKIWYGVPDSTSSAFHTALKTLVPNYCRNKALWLPSDTVMVPPNLLVENGVSLSRIVQEPGQFIVVFPKVFTSSLSTGYVVSESVYFAPLYWLQTGRTVFNELRESCEPSMFSFDRLLLSIVNDARSNVEVLKQIIPAVQELCDKEKSAREKINSIGITATEKLPLPETSQVRKKRKLQSDDGEYECDICRMNLFVSMVTESQEDAVYCLDHAAEQIEMKKIQSKNCKLTYTYDIDELDALVEKIRSAINNKMQKKVPNKFAGLPTLLK